MSATASPARTAAPSTPKPAIPTVVSDSPTGSWRHPRLDEIIQRQNKTTFTEQNFSKAVWNLGFLLLTFILPSIGLTMYKSYDSSATDPKTTTLTHHFLHRFRLPTLQFDPLVPTVIGIAIWVFRAVTVFSFIQSILPLLRPIDDFHDIPLTPSQRSILGLPPLSPSAPPPTPGSKYITPPRYTRSSTPSSRRSNSTGIATAGSPLSTRSVSQSPLSFSTRGEGGSKSRSNSPFSPSSPLLQKVMGGSATRRLSYGNRSPLGMEALGFGDSTPGTPTPAGGRGASSVPLTNRWLYERERMSPRKGIY
ncbi:hypothetical protein M501DRAFT_543733 [Patellaria atrata CBS 101060]|uniref:Nuclear pore complex component n=1 Tax=Patellaria atrata CBS 101060 TaxID=1346257 RepID=A0A9P4SEU9_9PEZI|nr:hypothetical protein M501DRAFT_543733 [Patellaria atrata CBS 101060]